MPRAVYTLEFELAYNTWTDVSADWLAAAPLVIERGIEPGERVAGVGRMTFSLHNPDGRYTLGHAQARPGFQIGIGARLWASDGTNTALLFYGRVAAITPAREAGVSRIRPTGVAITCEDQVAALGRTRPEVFPLLFDVAPRELVNHLVDASFAPPGVLTYWRLGHPEASLLGQTTTLPGTYTGKDFDTGQSVFPWAGDTWDKGVTAYRALVDVCQSEGGTFHLAADGTPVFADRHARPRHTDPEAVIDGGLAGLEAGQADRQLINRAALTVYPRAVGTPGSTLWEAEHEIRLPPGQSREIVCRYVDPDQMAAVVGALNMVSPAAGEDYAASDAPGGAGTDRTDQVRVSAVFGGSSARLTLTNTWKKPLYVHLLRVRGTPLRAFQPATVLTEDDASTLAYERRTLRVDLPLQDDAAVAADMALALLSNRKDPHPWPVLRVEATTGAAPLAQAILRDVGDRVHVSDQALALDAAGCFIEQIRHEITAGGASHRVTWRTSPADLESYWVLGTAGFAGLGTTARLGY